MRSTVMAGCIALTMLAACKNETKTTSTTATPTTTVSTTTSTSSVSMTPEQLGELGAEIKRHPSDAKKILSDHGLDEASFEKAIRSVSSDPDASRRYAAAYKKRS